MDLQTKKLELIDWLVNLKDETLLNKIFTIRKEYDWFQDLSTEAKQSIKSGQKDYKDGNTHSHENVMTEAKAKYNIK